jgi:hypothetical protein
MDMNEQRLAFVREKMGVPDTILTRGDGAELDYSGDDGGDARAGGDRRDGQQQVDVAALKIRRFYRAFVYWGSPRRSELRPSADAPARDDAAGEPQRAPDGFRSRAHRRREVDCAVDTHRASSTR